MQLLTNPTLEWHDACSVSECLVCCLKPAKELCLHVGVVVGKQFRVVEWDIQNSPREPDGPCVTINIRATQLNPKGLRTEISKAYRLDSSKQVKQFRHCFVFGPIIFYEQLDNPQAISKLQEGGIIVWTRARLFNLYGVSPVSRVND